MTIPDAENMHFLKDHCPICKSELKSYCDMDDPTCMILGSMEFFYCPDCDILKEFDYNYCADCNSAYHYTKNRKGERILKDGIWDIDLEIEYLKEKNSHMRGIKKLREQKMDLEKRLPDHICWYCDNNDFSITQEEMKEMEESGKAKIGYEISRSPIIRISLGRQHECAPSDVMTRLRDDIYKLECKTCKKDSYVKLSNLEKTELSKILGIKKNAVLDEIETPVFREANTRAMERLRNAMQELHSMKEEGN